MKTPIFHALRERIADEIAKAATTTLSGPDKREQVIDRIVAWVDAHAVPEHARRHHRRDDGRPRAAAARRPARGGDLPRREAAGGSVSRPGAASDADVMLLVGVLIAIALVAMWVQG